MTSKPEMDVTLELTGDGFSPEEVTRAIGLAPTKTWRAGDLVQGTQVRRRHDGWVFGLPYRRAHDMEALLKELLDALGPYAARIAGAIEKFRLKSTISFGVYIDVRGQTPSCFFTAGTLTRLANLRADLNIDLILTESSEA